MHESARRSGPILYYSRASRPAALSPPISSELAARDAGRPRGLRPIQVGHPGLDLTLDLIRGQMVSLRGLDEGRQLLLGGKAERDELRHRQPRQRGLLQWRKLRGAHLHLDPDDAILQP